MDFLDFLVNDDAFSNFKYEDLASGYPSTTDIPLSEPLNTDYNQPEELMPHEWFLNLLDQHEESVQELLEADPAYDEAGNQAQVVTDESNAYEEDEREFGWTRKENEGLANVIRDLIEKAAGVYRVSWREITNEFNRRHDQTRTKTQLYSHVRYARNFQRMPCYLKAEEELLLALDELGLPARSAAPFLKTPRSDKLLELKLLKLKAAGRAATPKDRKQANFRKRVREFVNNNFDRAAFENCRPPKRALENIQSLIGNNSDLKRKYMIVRQPGRPKKETKMVPVTEQLKTLFKPFVYINKRRRRTACLPGDGRIYGMNMFCLNRLLGSPLEIDKMPSRHDDAVQLGVEHSDVAIYSVLRDLMCSSLAKRPEEETEEESYSVLAPELCQLTDVNTETASCDMRSYCSGPDYPPAESILPPTLYSTTGARGLLLYCDTLKEIVGDKTDEPLGNEECDAKLERFLCSVFNLPNKLLALPTEGEDNSDGESDDDDEACYSNFRQFVDQLKSDLNQAGIAPELQQDEDSFETLINDDSVCYSNFRHFVEQSTSDLHQAYSSAPEIQQTDSLEITMNGDSADAIESVYVASMNEQSSLGKIEEVDWTHLVPTLTANCGRSEELYEFIDFLY